MVLGLLSGSGSGMHWARGTGAFSAATPHAVDVLAPRVPLCNFTLRHRFQPVAAVGGHHRAAPPLVRVDEEVQGHATELCAATQGVEDVAEAIDTLTAGLGASHHKGPPVELNTRAVAAGGAHEVTGGGELDAEHVRELELGGEAFSGVREAELRVVERTGEGLAGRQRFAGWHPGSVTQLLTLVTGEENICS